jgi:hypothetical protein
VEGAAPSLCVCITIASFLLFSLSLLYKKLKEESGDTRLLEYNKRKSVFFFFLVLVGAGSDPFFSKVGASLGATHIAAWPTNENEFGKRI